MIIAKSLADVSNRFYILLCINNKKLSRNLKEQTFNQISEIRLRSVIEDKISEKHPIFR